MRSTLWQCLCDLPIEMGHVHAFFPLGVTARELMHFAWSLHRREALEAEEVDFSYRWAEREVIEEYLNGQENRVVVFYGDTVAPGGRPRNYDGPITTYYNVLSYPNRYSAEVPTRTEVYYVIRAGVSKENLHSAMDNAVERMPFMACLTSLREHSASFPADKQLNNEMLKGLAERAMTLLVSAYANDVNLIWTRA